MEAPSRVEGVLVGLTAMDAVGGLLFVLAWFATPKAHRPEPLPR
jgi:hypothetical protein